HIAEIVNCQSWHDSVEVSYADALACDIIEHDVIELGVVVGDALRQVRIKQDACDGLMRYGELNLRFCKNCATRRIGGDCLLQCHESFRRMVKVFDGIVQS